MWGLAILLALAPSEVSLDVPVYVSAELETGTLEIALKEVADIFAPGAIRLQFSLNPETALREHRISVVVQDEPARFVVHGCRRGRHDHRLGNTHLLSRRITLWSRQVARAVDGNWDSREPPEVDEGMHARALGRVFAHELGHLLLRLNEHREDGLMRSSFSHRSLTARGGRSFRLSKEDLERIRSAIVTAKAAEGG